MTITDVPDTGLGATLSFSVLSFAAKILTIKLPDHTREKLNISNLGTEGFMEYMMSDLVEPGEVEITCLHPTSIDVPVPNETVTQTCTVTLPLRKVASSTTTSNETVAANVAGSGFFVNWSGPTLQVGQLQVSTIRFAYDGGTGPTHTKSA